MKRTAFRGGCGIASDPMRPVRVPSIKRAEMKNGGGAIAMATVPSSTGFGHDNSLNRSRRRAASCSDRAESGLKSANAAKAHR